MEKMTEEKRIQLIKESVLKYESKQDIESMIDSLSDEDLLV